jgi:ABC-2 type transport system ATP-binding protein
MIDLTTQSAISSDPSARPPAIIEIQGLRRRYGKRFVLDGVDLTMSAGSVLGLLGRNGAGKSTLLRCMLGLSPSDGGTIQVFGTASAQLGGREKERIGYVAQQSAFQIWMNATQVVAYVSAFYERWDTTLVQRLLRDWEIPPTQRIGTLSPGEAQRLAIILALGHHPELMIMDEPAASLDPSARRAVIAAVLEAVASDGTAVVLSTHLTSDLERVADRVAFLAGGRISIDSDLGSLKDSIKRLSIVAPALPESLELPGIIACERRDGGAVVTMRLGGAETWSQVLTQLTSRYQASVALEDLSLEDIFLAVNR